MRPSRVLCLLPLLVLVLAACDDASPLHAFVSESRTELVGGPGAIGEPGDVVLENDRIRLVISRAGASAGPGMFGGSIVDADVRRPTFRFSQGRGLDQFSEVFPMANLIVPGFLDEGGEGADPEDLQVTVVDDGSSGRQAVVRVTGKGDSLIEVLGALGFVGVETDLSFETDLILEPGKRYVRIRTRLNVDRMREPDAGDDPEADAPMEPLGGPQPLFGALLGDLLRPADERELAPGIVAGDFLLFGPKVKIFAPGLGFDVARSFQQRYEAGEDLINDPFTVPYLAATGDRVSYAFFTEDGLLSVPIFTSSFTGAFTHLYQCRLDDADCTAALSDGRIVYERFFGIGDGDVASALEGFHEVRGEPAGTLSGHVLDGATGRPLSGADVFLVRDPGGAPASWEELERQNRAADGTPGVVLQARSDVDAEARPLGAFRGRVAPGDYFLVARARGRGNSAPLRVHVGSGGHTEVTIVVPAPGRLDVAVVDERGAPSPGKLTLVGPGPCDPEAPAWAGLSARSADQAVALTDPEISDGIARTFYLVPGGNEVHAPPGTYEALVSRGVEYSLHRECVTLDPHRTTLLRAVVAHVVDTTGWVSGDFHVHGFRSFDASPSDAVRVLAAVGEGLDLMSSSDHDVVTDFAPEVEALGLSDRLATMIGLETTTIETGHYIGFPLRFDELARQNGAIEWSRRDLCVRDPGASGCRWGADGVHLPLVPDEIFGALRNLGSLSPEETVVLVPHPRDGFFGYFDQFGMSPYDLVSSPGGIARENPVIDPGLYSGAFDAIELFNGKRFELIRTPSISEIYELQARRAAAGSPEELSALHEELARRVLTRTPEEAAALRLGEAPPPRGGECATSADCRPDERCGTRGLCIELECEPEEAEDPELADKPCVDHQGVIDDWFRLLNHGVRRTGMGNSDTHELYRLEVGLPRNWIASPTDAPAEIEGRDIAAAVREGRVSAGYGPFVELWVDGAPIGSTVVPTGPGVQVRVRVQTPEWFGVDRVEIYRNGELWQERQVDADPTEIVDFDETISDEPATDAWYAAVAIGLEGSLAPIYTSQAHLTLGFTQVLDAAFRGIQAPALSSFLSPAPTAPELTPIVPYSITNPVWVDRDGDGFDPIGAEPEWAHGATSELPLTSRRLQDPFREPILTDEELQARRFAVLRQLLARAMGH